MIKNKLIASIVGGALSFGTVCYTYETFRFEDIRHIYNNFDEVEKKYEVLKENRDKLLSRYNNLFNSSKDKIDNLESELNEKEEYIKSLEEKLKKDNEENKEEIKSNEVDIGGELDCLN